ncbi:ferritin family protein [Mesorhizobium sp. L-8-3]|uniref:ferritin family protein n=1 Tax=Mesorhizobium sp. L-8-3 TaxID=2744522 RepID=UPI0019253716|nr:ferritin family protein [Mesorhizobium sp. L-8-3]
MPRLKSEPSRPIRSMEELLAVAMAMEKDSADRYAGLAGRMRAAGRPELADVFEQLVAEETGHMDMVAAWSKQIGLRPEVLHAGPAPEGVFDDEGIGLVSPELVEAYRSLAIAVRNEERAFAFWSYVAAQNASPEIRQAAERMAREELEHAKTLRRARRKAFFAGRHAGATVREPHDLAELELEVCRKLEQRADEHQGASDYRALALEARKLSLDLASDPLQDPAPVGLPPPRSLDALCEWLVDFYIEAGETLPSQAARERAQALATTAVRRLATVRHLEEGRE